MNETIYLYDGSFEGFLCCIFDSYANKEVLTAIVRDEDFLPTLFKARTIETNTNHAQRVLIKLHKTSPYGVKLLKKGFLASFDNKELFLYRLAIKMINDGPRFLLNLSDETLNPVYRAVRNLDGEVHLLRGFIRFSEFGGILGSEIKPKNRVLPILQSHFCSRYQNEKFFIYDRTNKEALFYANGIARIIPLADFQMAQPDEKEAHYRLLWKRFYDTIAIKERENPKLRQSNMPKRYWGTMTEFQSDSFFIPQNTSAIALTPDAPNVISAPETR